LVKLTFKKQRENSKSKKQEIFELALNLKVLIFNKKNPEEVKAKCVL
jgi:hypothetical protein